MSDHDHRYEIIVFYTSGLCYRENINLKVVTAYNYSFSFNFILQICSVLVQTTFRHFVEPQKFGADNLCSQEEIMYTYSIQMDAS